MNYKAWFTAIFFVFTGSAFAAPVTYTLDPEHTEVVIQWNHMGFSNPIAVLGQASGTLVYDAENIENSSTEVTMQIANLHTSVAELDEHLHSADFFDAAQYPQASFKSTMVHPGEGDKLVIMGDLTIKGVTQPVSLDVTLNGAGEHPMAKKAAIGFDAKTTIIRSQFGIDGFVPAVSDEVRLRITTEAVAQ